MIDFSLENTEDNGYTDDEMMRIPRIYLETTIFNFPFAEDAP